MSDRCPNCHGVLNALFDCIECGCCALCYPFDCVCAYDGDGERYEEEEDIWLTEDDEAEGEYEDWEYEQNKWEDARMDYLGAIWGYLE